jgi:hypothetical protein
LELSEITVAVPYQQAVTPVGGTAPYAFSVTGNLPPGITLSASGQLAGTPSVIGTYQFTVIATDANNCNIGVDYTLVVSCPTITINPTTLPVGEVGQSYSQTLTASGGTAPYTWVVSGLSLPGLSIDASGQLSGTLSGSGSLNLTVTATDAYGCSGSQTFSLTVSEPTPEPTATPTPEPTPSPSDTVSTQLVLLTEENSERAIALDSVSLLRDSVSMLTPNLFSSDGHSRLMLFALNVELQPGETPLVITASAEDAEQRIYQLTVEYVGRVPQFDWLTQVIIKLPDEVANTREVWVSIKLRGTSSNKVLVRIRP